MTKRELSQVYHITNEIKMLQEELDKIRQDSIMGCIGTEEHTDGGGGSGDRVSNSAIEAVYLEQVIEKKMLELERKKKEIVEYIYNIDDSYIRQILYHRYISCRQWNDIARRMGGTAESIRRTHNRFLLKK